MNASATNAVQFHNGLAAGWEQKYSRPAFRSREEIVRAAVREVAAPGQRWLDAGCGTGRLSRIVAECGCTVLGVDASAEMIRAASEYARLHPSAAAMSFQVIESVEEMQLGHVAFDGALCISVLEYLNSPANALKRCASALRTGGTLIVAVPNRLSMLRRGLSAAFSVSKALRGRGWPEYLKYSRHEYSRGSFAELLDAAGFDLGKTVYFGGPMPRALQNTCLTGPLMLCVARKR